MKMTEEQTILVNKLKDAKNTDTLSEEGFITTGHLDEFIPEALEFERFWVDEDQLGNVVIWWDFGNTHCAITGISFKNGPIVVFEKDEENNEAGDKELFEKDFIKWFEKLRTIWNEKK
jgi:hypothetical protein